MKQAESQKVIDNVKWPNIHVTGVQKEKACGSKTI